MKQNNLTTYKLQPTPKELNNLKKYLIPKVDIYFFKKYPEYNNINKSDIITVEKFKATKYYNKLQYINFYETWHTLKEANYIWIDKKCIFKKLPKEEEIAVLKEQLEISPGNIIPIKINQTIYQQNNNFVITNESWKELSEEEKDKLIFKIIEEYEDNTTYPLNFEVDAKIKKIINTYLTKSDCNCLALTLYAKTKNKKYLHMWVNEETFYNNIKDRKEIKPKELKANDIVVFMKDNKIIHSSYYLGKNLFLNKSGQSPFNPITLKTLNDLKQEWQNTIVKIYRTI